MIQICRGSLDAKFYFCRKTEKILITITKVYKFVVYIPLLLNYIVWDIAFSTGEYLKITIIRR
jgi:hypothetical protein